MLVLEKYAMRFLVIPKPNKSLAVCKMIKLE